MQTTQQRKRTRILLELAPWPLANIGATYEGIGIQRLKMECIAGTTDDKSSAASRPQLRRTASGAIQRITIVIAGEGADYLPIAVAAARGMPFLYRSVDISGSLGRFA